MIGLVLSFLASTVGRYVVGSVGVVALFVAFKSHEQHAGAAKAVAKIEKATTDVVKKADTAGARVRDTRTRGMLDPNVRAGE